MSSELAAVLVFVVLACLVGGIALWGLAYRYKTRAAAGLTSKRVTVVCEHCDNTLDVAVTALTPLRGSDVALAVRAAPHVRGLPLFEYICPHCGAAHCFARYGRRIEWVGVNLWDAQMKSAHCHECHGPLARPQWKPGTYDGRLTEAPELPDRLGLVCKHCKAICCLSCCRQVTRRRFPEGEYLCPRCARPPMNQVFHP